MVLRLALKYTVLYSLLSFTLAAYASESRSELSTESYTKLLDQYNDPQYQEGNKKHENLKTALRSIASIEPSLAPLHIKKFSFPPLVIPVD